MKTISVNASKSYTVTVGSGLLNRLGDTLRAVFPKGARVMLVTDDTVRALHADSVLDTLTVAGFRTEIFSFPAGEASKNTETLFALWQALAGASFSRTDGIVALGGGVVGDLAGFAAATYLRGIPCFQVPTTLLAMVDSSVGGKTAVDLAAGKNLVGAFSQPVGVLCDTDVLGTLSPADFADGCAEVIKYGYLGDPELLALLEEPISLHLEEVIARCVEKKRQIVEEDELDRGNRQLLNLGHTAGHAVEKLSKYSISHGKAVAIGMMIMAKAAAARGICPKNLPLHMEKMLCRYALPTEAPFAAAELAAAALADKKRRGDVLTVVLPTALGKSELFDLKTSELTALFAAGVTK